MNLSEMFTLLSVYVDDIVDNSTATNLFNAGQNKLAIDAKAVFPQLSPLNPLGTFVFPEKYHEAPVLYAAAMVKSQDSSMREKGSYLEQFEMMKQDFTENYSVPIQYRDEIFIQHYISQEGQTAFVIDKDTYNRIYGNLKVYNNGIPVNFQTFKGASAEPYQTTLTYSNHPNSFQLLKATQSGDIVTALWDIRYEFDQPPLPWNTW